MSDLSKELLYVADDLQARGYLLTGVLRRAARVLATATVVDTDDGCRGCGAELEYSGLGRPRLWCSERCRRRKRP